MKEIQKMMILGVAAALALSLVFAACGGGGGETGQESGSEEQSRSDEKAEEGDKELRFGLFNWAENIAVTNMWALLLEERGYTVEIVTGDKSPVWTGVAEGDLDIHFESWMPSTDKPLWEEYSDTLDEYGPWYEGTQLGLTVPEYVDVDSIEELNDNRDKFIENNRPSIVGIDSGSSLMKLTDEALEEYDLDLNLISSSGPVMTASIIKAVENEEPIVATLWKPHWIFAEVDLKFLEDPKNIYGQDESIYFVTHESFEERHPEVVEWMQNWKMDDQSLGSLMGAINESDSPEEGAQEWIEANSDLVDSWFE
ncbi:MAG: glycine betaine ABC transporter substrate-binding protein [Spirochaetaceae bacterium]